MNWIQKEIRLKARSRGFHLVTDEVEAALPELADFAVGVAHIFIRHTSASLTLNENADPTVRADMEDHFSVLAPEDAPYYRHTSEGADDMPAHIKASLLGSSVTVPITGGRLNMGTWQGLYLCEHRDRGGSRRLTVTLSGK
ncbi:MAG: secondary thiamine-phosphate synthase enzyme YjbQ [Elusimicrobiota bacterium]